MKPRPSPREKTMAAKKLYLNVPFAEKDQAKALGARWDPAVKKWYVPEGKAADPFERWHSGQTDWAGQPQPAAKPGQGDATKIVAITLPADKNFVPYDGEEPPWD